MALNIQNTALQISAGRVNQFPSDPIVQIALSGRSNVGKSSLINTLLGRKSLARVSSTPGKTITINFYNVDKKLLLADLPGYGFAKRAKDDQKGWSALAESYFTANPNIDRVRLVVQLVDIKAGITTDDSHMLSFLADASIPYVVAVTKVDKLNKTERAAALAAISEHPALLPGAVIIPFSSKDGEGKSALWGEIMKSAKLP